MNRGPSPLTHPHIAAIEPLPASVATLTELLVSYGARRTLGAIERVLANGTHHAKAIAWVLAKEDK